MANSVYKVNKAINKPIEFKGLKAQYIWWLGGGLLALLLVFAVLYLLGVHPFLCIAIVVFAGTGLFMQVYMLSRKYGQHGMMKVMAQRLLPKVIKGKGRKLFIHLCKR